MADEGLILGNDISIGSNKMKKNNLSHSPSIEFDDFNNIIITIPSSIP